MNSFTGKLDQLEAKLQIFIEGKLSRLSPFGGGYDGLSRQLVSSMRAGTMSTGDGILLAPDQFTLLIHPSQAESFDNDPNLLEGLANLILEVGKESGLHFGQHPVVTVSHNEDVKIDGIDIIARISDKVRGNTANLSKNSNKNENAIPQNAFLIVDGRDVFPLTETVINIGRRSNNHLVIEDPRISRQHAQIRATHSQYEIFDLDSTGGTFINKQQITQSLLHPGDVISLAGVYLIYGHENSGSLGDTKKLTSYNDLDRPGH